MQEVGDDGEQCRLLAAVLGRGGGEGAADLAVQCASRPEAAGLVEKIRHLRGHPAEARAGADDDGVVVDEIIDLGDRRGLIELVMRGLCDIRRHEFGHALDIDGGACFARAFGNGIRHVAMEMFAASAGIKLLHDVQIGVHGYAEAIDDLLEHLLVLAGGDNRAGEVVGFAERRHHRR